MCRAAFGEPDSTEVEAILRLANLHDVAEKALGTVFKLINSTPAARPDSHLLARLGADLVLAVAGQHDLPDSWVVAYAAPWKESGALPEAWSVPAPGQTRGERFVTRLAALTEVEWGQATCTSDYVHSAFRDAIMGHEATARSAITSLDSPEVTAALVSLELLFGHYSPWSGSAELWRMMSRTLSEPPEVSDARVEALLASDSGWERAARNGLVAVLAAAGVEESVVAGLYVPFASVIPWGSLDPR